MSNSCAMSEPSATDMAFVEKMRAQLLVLSSREMFRETLLLAVGSKTLNLNEQESLLALRLHAGVRLNGGGADAAA